jgi:hypothetical protein
MDKKRSLQTDLCAKIPIYRKDKSKLFIFQSNGNLVVIITMTEEIRVQKVQFNSTRIDHFVDNNYFMEYFLNKSTFSVFLVGGRHGNEGNVYALNHETGVEGPICDDAWSLISVSF